MLEPRYQPTPEKYIGKSISQTLSENLFAPSNLITTNCRKYIIKLKLIPNQDLSRERAAQKIFPVFVSMFHSTLLKRHWN